MTYRERQEAKAERYREWAEKREASSTANRERSDQLTAGIPFGQPILVGHHSERRHRNAIDKSWNAMGRAVEDGRKADSMRSRADNIEAAAGRAIYSDDSDAIERLKEKLAGLEAERDRIKAYNASCRKAAKAGGIGDTSILDEAQRASLESVTRHCPYQLRAGGAMPAYATSNLGGVISNTRKRITQLEREKTNGGPPDRIITARYGGSCEDCGAQIERGDTIRYSKAAGARCAVCKEEA